LLLVITGGLYLLHLDVLSNVLILASTVLLARLDLVRIRVLPPPLVLAVMLSLLVLGGAGLGRVLEARYEPLQAPLARSRPAPRPVVTAGPHPIPNRVLPHLDPSRTQTSPSALP
jgi:hypothetical protein